MCHVYFGVVMSAKDSKQVSQVVLPFVKDAKNFIDFDGNASLKDTETSILGINHIGISVTNLDEMLNFYQTATQFQLLGIDTVTNNLQADKLYGVDNIEYRKATLLAPNMLLELTEFVHNKERVTSPTPVQGPGMTHTCYQSPITDPGYRKFRRAGAQILSRGEQPIDLGGYGLTYAYGYDPEGNMFEMEQADQALLDKSGYDETFAVLEVDKTLWMSQVAIATSDISRLTTFYQQVLGILPYRAGEYLDNVRIDQVADHDKTHLCGTTFKMSQKAKILELWQFVNPKTPESTLPIGITDIGYTFSIEVADIFQEQLRLAKLGLTFVSEPILLGEFWQVFTRDIDGNVFSLRQAKEADSSLSVLALDPDWHTK